MKQRLQESLFPLNLSKQYSVMNLSLLSIILPFLISVTTGGNAPAHLTGDFSINSGAVGSSPANNGRKWIGDMHSDHLSSVLQIKGSSTTTSAVNNKLVSADPIPHKTARISLSQFSYEFQANPGQKIVRLHFNPSPYKGFKGFKDLFTVEAGPFTLLSNFSASLTAYALGVDFLVKEFCLSVRENEVLDIVFSPESSQSLDTYAFVNGIEIITVPASLSYFHGGDIDHNTALEIVHRLEVGRNRDFDDMFPTWATGKARKRESNSWKIPVDVGFRYLIRLHLSELGLKMVGRGEVMFSVLINEVIAQANSSVVKVRDVNSIPWYRDYVVMMRGHKKEGKRDLLISLQSSDELIGGHVLLSGFEIFKLSNPDNSLASPNAMPPARDSPSHTIHTLLLVLGHKNTIAFIVITIISLVNIIVHKLREIREAFSIEEENKPSARAERVCRRFSLTEIQLATRNFSDALLIGRGGFGKVYIGLVDDGQKFVAAKRLKSNSKQGAREFLTEIETLSELRHVNLVSLIGYCNEHREMILVYDYMEGKTLADHLYKLPRESNSSSLLTWKHRLNICIGAGRGLDYLHTGLGVIHRDVKASNILLDGNFVAKVSDFGLAKTVDDSKLWSHVSTKVKGTRGYLDPYYCNTSKLTRKSDTYAFGVVLLEVLCGRPAVDSGVADDERILRTWARDKISKGEVDQIVDSSLRMEISPDSLKTFVAVAERCLNDEPKNRPTMSQVVLQLESSLEQQDNEPVQLLNEIASVPHHEIDQSVKTGEPTVVASIYVTPPPPPPPPLEKQTSNKVTRVELPSGSEDRIHKPLRIWPWDTFRTRVKLSKKNEFSLLSVPHETTRISRSKFFSTYRPRETARISHSKIFNTFRLRMFTKKKAYPTSALEPHSNFCRSFSFGEIKSATCNFDQNFRVGEGGFGYVYKGFIDGGATAVAVKRLHSSSKQGVHEFLTEIKLLSMLRHRHLVSLIGCCHKNGEMILVYDYMANGNLKGHLYNNNSLLLTWNQRLQICLGAAQGLHYLHSGAELSIIHRDVKSSNILLDEKWVAKMSDFGLSKLGPDNGDTHVSTHVAGTIGYLDPEYIIRGLLTAKSDVYSFGVVLLEVLCGRPPVDSRQPEGQEILADWATICYGNGTLATVIDSNLKGQIATNSLDKFAETAIKCLNVKGNERPAMGDVVRSLEFAMKLQEIADASGESDIFVH